jgi:hypothetical protein
MDIQKENWIRLILAYDDNINDALQQQHHAAQFIALVGRHLIPPQPDDSNTSMNYDANEQSLIGNPMSGGLRIGVKLTDMVLYFCKDDLVYPDKIPLVGRTKDEVFGELKQKLSDLGVETSNLINELHYEIPDHALEKGAKFTIKDKVFFQECTYYRHNARLILNEFVKEYQDTAPLRIWPHHFDTGSFIPVKHNSKGEVTQSIGLGWTIPDSMVDEPYFYLSFWSEKPAKDINQLPPPDTGEWIYSGWQGGVLKHSDILKLKTSGEQEKSVRLFLDSGLNIIMNQFNN